MEVVGLTASPLAAQDIMFIETSAKEGFNIKLLFRRLATVCCKAGWREEAAGDGSWGERDGAVRRAAALCRQGSGGSPASSLGMASQAMG